MSNHHDVLGEIIDLFVYPSFKKRLVYLWEKPKRRAQLLDELLLDVALAEVVGKQYEVLLYCHESQVAFGEDHNGHQLLHT